MMPELLAVDLAEGIDRTFYEVRANGRTVAILPKRVVRTCAEQVAPLPDHAPAHPHAYPVLEIRP